jgi:hypothetical protein
VPTLTLLSIYVGFRHATQRTQLDYDKTPRCQLNATSRKPSRRTVGGRRVGWHVAQECDRNPSTLCSIAAAGVSAFTDLWVSRATISALSSIDGAS